MGHKRLGSLPDTAPWRHVVEVLAGGADVPKVAAATTQAALHGLRKARKDEGLAESVLLLTEVVRAARGEDFAAALYAAGIEVPDQPGVFDLTSGLGEVIDRHLQARGTRTDFGEMARLAAVESLTRQLSQRCQNLFETTPEDVRGAAYDLSTRDGFATLAHDFFASLTQRFLTYHLGRELPHHVGGNCRFADPAEHNEFVDQLGVHCREAAVIVRTYAGDWYSKANFEGGIDADKARAFADRCLVKLRRELERRGGRDAE